MTSLDSFLVGVFLGFGAVLLWGYLSIEIRWKNERKQRGLDWEDGPRKGRR